MRRKGSADGKPGAPVRCVDILQGALHGLGLGRVTRSLALLRAWDQAVAPRIRERASVEEFRDGRLYVCVEDPIWLHELHMLRHKLKTILNEAISEPVVAEIVLRIGRPRRGVTPGRPPRAGRKAQAVPAGFETRVATLLTPLKELPCHASLERLLRQWVAKQN